ncbi:LuxR family transcriptional regulator [Burkholderia sp. AU31624]|uniref:helix-turn-helix transcriptional regulator n=1 Tax=Burkholderia sp. AU31624 TaxID=2879629 RepID=UPI001CF4EFC1|nr:LuxR family transcriptional regulator [Burkholderia sp. AU31624]MCA8258145.1 LuxR family transcriptional regulator [Burkholderia sp. AU31624]
MVDEFMPILQSQTMEELGAHVGSFCREAGYQTYMYSVVSSGSAGETAFSHIISNCPAWQDVYAERRYANIDPILAHARTSSLPLRWERAMYSSGEQRCLEADARRFGLVHGLSLPVRGHRGDIGVLSVASDGSEGIPAHDLGQTAKLSLLCAYIEEKVTMVARETKGQGTTRMSGMSSRERQCLQWCSAGKTSWEIGEILGITERTVNFHIGNVVRKLNAKGRRHAVTKAISLGLLCV